MPTNRAPLPPSCSCSYSCSYSTSFSYSFMLRLLLLLVSPLLASTPTVEVLDNGLTVIVEERRAAPIVVVNIWVRQGSKHEDPKDLGASHYLEHMFYRGTAKRVSLQNREEILALGGKTSAATWYDWTNYYNIVPSEHFVLALDGLTDGCRNATLDEAQIENERSVVGEEIRQRVDDPTTFVYEEMMGLAFGKHPYALRVVGTHETVGGMTHDSLAKYYARYGPANLVVAIVGDVDTDTALDEVRSRLGDETPTTQMKSPPVPNRFRAGGRKVIERADLGQSYLAGGFRVPGYRHPDRAAIEVAARLLYGRLQSRLVEGDRTASEVNAHAFVLDDQGLFAFTARPIDVEDIRLLERCCLEEVARFRDAPPGEDEAASMVRYFQLQELFGDETAFARAQSLGLAALNGDVRYATEYEERLSEVTAADVRRVARLYLVAENYSSVTLMPKRVRLPEEEEARIVEVLGKMAAGTDDPEGLDFSREAYGGGVSATAGTRGGESGGLPTPEEMQLTTGLRVLAARRPDSGVIELGFYVQAGTICDPAGKAGCAALAVRLMQEGGAKLDRTGVLVELNRIGGQWSLEVDRDAMSLRLTVAPDDVEAGLAVIRDVLAKPKLPREAFPKVRDALLASIREENDTLSTVAWRRLFGKLFLAHPYARPRSGEEAEIRTMTTDDVREWVHAFVRPERTVAIVVGDRDTSEMTQWIGHAMDDWEGSGSTGQPQTGEAQTDPIEVSARMQKEQSYGTIGVLLPRAGSEDGAALAVLGETIRMRMFRDLIYAKALAYTASGWVDQMKEAGYLAVFFSTRPERFEETLSEARGHLDRAYEEGVPEDEVATIRERLSGARVLDSETGGDLVEAWGPLEAIGLGWAEEARSREAIDGVTPEQVAAAAKLYLAPERRVTVRVTPGK